MDLTGIHSARAVMALLGETKKGDPQVGVEFEITDIEGARPHITWYGFFTEKTEERTIESLRICGWTGTDFTAIEVGADVSLVIEQEEYEGKTRNRVKWVNRASGGLSMAKQMEGDKAKAFAARMKGKLLAFDQKNGSSKKSNGKPPEPPPHNDNDLPF